jgi:hypothetical protein
MSSLTQLVPTLLVKDLPKGFIMKIEIDNYEVEVDYRNQEALEIFVHYTESLDRWAEVRILDPNPDVTIDEIVREAQALIEKFIKKKASTAEA